MISKALSAAATKTQFSRPLLSTAVLIPLMSVAVTAQAEVKSLSSSELTETYIEDSTIIVTPKEAPSTTQTTVSSLTIAPVESSDQDIIELKNAQEHQEGTTTSFELNDELLRNASVESAINPPESLLIPSYQETITRDVADILNDERYRVPEGDFDFDYVGNDLGLSRSAEQITFSIGNLPGIDKIELPQGIEPGGPVELIPREGGGFDLTINIPQDNQ